MVARHKKNQRGQVTVEMVLIGSIICAVVIAVSQGLRNAAWAEQMLAGPWDKVSSMIESGVWESKGPDQARTLHPNFNLQRRVSIKGTIE